MIEVIIMRLFSPSIKIEWTQFEQNGVENINRYSFTWEKSYQHTYSNISDCKTLFINRYNGKL